MYDQGEVILEAKNVSRHFPVSHKRMLIANNDISIRIYKGKTLGLVGESGCGKSTFMKLLISLDRPTGGEILYRGRDISRLQGEAQRQSRQNIQMVFQDPSSSFNPKMRVKDILCEPLLNFKKIKKTQMEETAKRLLRMVELPESFADRYTHGMSGGEKQRVAIARALALEPEIVIMDEATCALDVSVQKAIIDLIVKLQKEKGITIVFICHDIALVQNLAHQVAVMYLGNIVEVLPGEAVAGESLHPYTKALVDAVFDLHMDYEKKIESLSDEVPSPLDVPSGCPFQSRCRHCMDICRTRQPQLKEIKAGHSVACHLF